MVADPAYLTQESRSTAWTSYVHAFIACSQRGNVLNRMYVAANRPSSSWLSQSKHRDRGGGVSQPAVEPPVGRRMPSNRVPFRGISRQSRGSESLLSKPSKPRSPTFLRSECGPRSDF